EKFPVAIREAKDFLKSGEGLDLTAVCKEELTIELAPPPPKGGSLAVLLSGGSLSPSIGGVGEAISSKSTLMPALAKWQAMRLPMMPLPRTATLFIIRFTSDVRFEI